MLYSNAYYVIKTHTNLSIYSSFVVKPVVAVFLLFLFEGIVGLFLHVYRWKNHVRSFTFHILLTVYVSMNEYECEIRKYIICHVHLMTCLKQFNNDNIKDSSHNSFLLQITSFINLQILICFIHFHSLCARALNFFLLCILVSEREGLL
jgi:hypothetical protein